VIIEEFIMKNGVYTTEDINNMETDEYEFTLGLIIASKTKKMKNNPFAGGL